MRQVALVGIVSVVLLTAAACGEQSPAGRIPDFPEQCVGKDGL